MTQKTNNQNKENISTNSKESTHSPDNNFSKPYVVAKGCYEPIYHIFQTLLLRKEWKQQDLADAIGIDKSNISRIVHGLQIPEMDLRLKISRVLGVDSCIIWRYQDLQYIKKLMKKQDGKGVGGILEDGK